MALYTTTVAALPSNTLELVGTGSSDTYGAIIDDVQLNSIPEPSLGALVFIGWIALPKKTPGVNLGV
jgi:hypothetical protein